MPAEFPFAIVIARDEAGRAVGAEIQQEVPGYDDPLVHSVTRQHPGVHHQALAAGLKRERIWPQPDPKPQL